MPTIPNDLPTTVSFSNQYRYVRLKRRWSDNWTYTPYIVPLRTTEALGPDMGAAELIYHVGTIKREQTTSFASFTPVDLRNYYVQVLMEEEGYAPQAMFHGIIADDQWVLDRASAASGNQFVSAYGLGFVLSRIELTGSYVLEGSSVQLIGRTVAFNQRRSQGRGLGRRLLGNRSTSPINFGSGGPTDVYAFENNGDIWSDLDVLRHLLYYYGPTSPRFVIAGQVQSLAGNYQVWDFEGDSLWSAINKIVDRRRGLGFSVDTSGSGNVVLRVASVADTPFGFGNQQLPANDRPVFFSFPTTHPYTHLVDRVSLRYTALNQFDEIEIRSKEPIKVCGTFSWGDATLVGNWNNVDATAYQNGAAAPPDDIEEHQRYRSTDRFSEVFRSFRVPGAWTWRCGTGAAGQGGAAVYVAAPTPRDDGTVDVDTMAPFWNGGHRFYPELPLLVNVDYSTSPPTDNNASFSEPDFQPLKGFLYDDVGDPGGYHQATNRWHQLDALSSIDDVHQDISIQSLENEMGVKLMVTPNHFLANNAAFNQTVVETWPLPEFSFFNLVITAFFATDQHQHVVLRGLQTTSNDASRNLVIEVADAEYWRILPQTIIGIGNDGNRVRVHDDNLTLRDDVQKLRITAAYAAAWYGVPRQAITLPIKRLGLFAPLGAMLTEIVDVWTRESVRSIISSRTCDYVHGTTTIETGWGNLEMPLPVQGSLG